MKRQEKIWVEISSIYTLDDGQRQQRTWSHSNARNHNEGIMPKGPYLPCVSIADRAPLKDTIELRCMGLCVFSVPISLVDDCENTCTLSYYHHQTGSMNHLPLCRIRSWNNGIRRMSFYVVMVIHNTVGRQCYRNSDDHPAFTTFCAKVFDVYQNCDHQACKTYLPHILSVWCYSYCAISL